MLNGLLLIDKDPGMTSHDVVARVRKILNQKEVGHSGTLDPMASGLMVLLLGEATKLSQYILDGDKTYHAKIRLGVVTDTLDTTGAILSEHAVDVSPQKVVEAARMMTGKMELSVPIYSAVKVDGKKLYELARAGETIQTPRRIMEFWSVVPRSDTFEANQISFSISCTKGGYIRAWAHELGQRLGCGAALSELRRVSSVPFRIEQALSLEKLNPGDLAALGEAFVSMEQSLPGVKKLKIRGQDLKLMHNGQIGHELKTQLIRTFNPQTDQLVQIHSADDGKLVALVGLIPAKGFTIRRVFKY